MNIQNVLFYQEPPWDDFTFLFILTLTFFNPPEYILVLWDIDQF